MVDLINDFKQVNPGLVRRRAADEAAVLPERVRRERQLLGERAADAASACAAGCRRAGARSRPSSSSISSASAWTPARRRSACARPGARSAASSPARPTASSWTATSSRTSSSTGVPTGWSSSATCRCAGRRSTGEQPARHRDRAAGSERRQRTVRRPHRAAEHPGPLPVPGRHGALQVRRGDWGHVQLAGIFRYIGWTDTLAGPVRPLRPCHRLGRQRERDPQGHEERHAAARGDVRPGHRELHERRAGRRGVAEQPRQPRHAGHRQGAPGLRHGRVLRLQLERPVLDRDRVFAARHLQQQRTAARGLQERPVREHEPALVPRQERDDGPRVPVGPPAELHRRVRASTTTASSSRRSTNFRGTWEESHEHETRTSRHPPRRRREGGPMSTMSNGEDMSRIEHDLLGDLPVPADAYYGVQTARALENFHISGRRAAALSQPHQGVRHGQARRRARELRLQAVLARRS